MHQSRSILLLLGLLLTAVACKETDGIEVNSVKFKGVEHIDASALQKALATRPSSWLPWGKKQYFDRARFDADLKRIQAFYLDRGFPDAKITSFDVVLNQSQDQVDITINVAEGQPTLAASIQFTGFDALPERSRRFLRNRMQLKEGARLDRASVATTRELATNVLRNNGYPYARVAVTEQPTPEPGRVAVSFVATPGVKAYFGPIDVAGNKSVDDNIIRRQLGYKPGDLYRRNVLLESQRKLYDLELFQFANIENLNAKQEPPEVPTRVTVAESKHQRVEFSAGYGTEDKLRGEGRWQHVNFLGGARQLGGHAKWSSLERGVRADFNQPYFFGSNFSLGLRAHLWYSDEPQYFADSKGIRATVNYRIAPRTSLSFSLNDEYTHSTVSDAALADPSFGDDLIALGIDPRTGTQQGTLNSISIGVQRSTAPNPLNARRGYSISAQFEHAAHWLQGTYGFEAVSGEARKYFPVAAGRHVVAVRLRYGTIRPHDDNPAEVPFFKRMFLGGADSLRGWGRYDVSPLTDSGQPIGGFTMLEGSGELRVSLGGNLGAVAFLDFGNVWLDPWSVRLNDLRYNIGPGFRYTTPVGPIRFDLGYQLNRIPGLLVEGEPEKRRWRVHFSIGQAF